MAKAASSGAGDAAEEQGKFGEILKLLRKKRPLNTAVRIGGPAKIVLEADKRKKPKALRKIAKDNGGGPKFVSGVISLQGKVITIQTIEEDFPGALQKLMKNYLRDMGQAGLRVEIVAGSADENGVADDDEDDEDAGSPSEVGAASEEDAASAANAEAGAAAATSAEAADAESPGTGGAADAARAKMMKAFRAMNQPLKGALATAEPQLRNRLGTLAKTFGAEVKGEDMRKAAGVLQLLKKTLDAAQNGAATAGADVPGAAPAAATEAGAEAAPAPDPAIEERRTSRFAQLDQLEARIESILSGLPELGGG